MKKPTHYYRPAHMTRTSVGNVQPCCDQPEAAHPPFVHGSKVRVRLRRQFRRLGGAIVPAGTILEAERDLSPSHLQEVRPSRWGTIPDGPYAGTFAELDKGEHVMVAVPGYTVRFDGDDHLTGLPVSYLAEVGS